MHVLLVGPDLEENLSLRYLSSALLAAGHSTEIATFESRSDLAAVVAAADRADLVGLSMCFQVRATEYLDLAAALKSKRPARPVVAGGHFASCAAAELVANHPALDVIVVHEGERALVELAEAAPWSPDSLPEIPGIVFRAGGDVITTAPRPIQEDLDALAWPDRTGPTRLVAGVPSAYLMGSRGCLSNCDYCCISTLHRLAPGKRFRQRDPEQIAGEMAALYHERRVRQFIFHDDNFLVPSVDKNLARIEALDRAMRRRGLRHVGLVLKCRPADADRQVLRRLREMGLLRVFLGVESGSVEGLGSIGRRQTVEEADRALQLCEELEISAQYTLIIFHPEATPRSLAADLAFARRHLAHPLSFCRAEAYAGTPLERRMLESSRACGDYLARTYRYTEPATALVWEFARDLLLERCFSQDNLQGQAIRLDHQAAVLRHFFDGRDVDALVEDFLAWELEVNRSTVAMLEELVGLCAEAGGVDSAELRRGVAELAARERESRKVLQGRGCKLREALRAKAYRAAGIPPPKARGRFQALPRQAVTLVAIGMLGCIEDHGVIEAPPPPMDGGIRTDAGKPPTTDGGFQEDSGVNETIPPPLDSGIQEDAGVMEAPPPPVDGGDSHD